MRTIYLIRHGEPERTGHVSRCLGHTNLALSIRGRKESMELASWFKSRCVEAVYSSPLSRCMETAEYIAGEQQRVHVEEGLVELDAGEWENMEFTEIRSRYPQLYEERDVPSARSASGRGILCPGRRAASGCPGTAFLGIPGGMWRW